MARAAIDVGSNSILLTVVDADGRVLHDEARVVGLGRGVGDAGVLLDDRMDAAERTLSDYAARARAFGVHPRDIAAVATSAARRASNALDFFASVERAHGVRVTVVSGDEEARLTWVGGLRDLRFDPASTLLVVDVGGGSTELVLGTVGEVRYRTSLEMGSVRLTERHLGDRGAVPDRFSAEGATAVRDEVREHLAGVSMDRPPDVVIGVAGTVTTLAAMALGLVRYDSTQVHGSSLDRNALHRFADELLRANAAERRRIAAVGADRADYLFAGAAILDGVLALAGRDRLVVSDRGLRFGLLTPGVRAEP